MSSQILEQGPGFYWINLSKTFMAGIVYPDNKNIMAHGYCCKIKYDACTLEMSKTN